MTYAAVAPSAPTGVSGVRGNGQVTVSWTAGSNGGSAITGYTVSASPQVGGVTKTCSSTSTSCTVAGLTNGTAYTFTVKATNTVGDSSASSASSSVTPTSADPFTVTATPTTSLSNGSSVSVGVAVDSGYTLYQTRVRLCASGATVANAGDFAPTLGGLCVNGPLAAGSDSDVVALTVPSNRASLTSAFRAGVGSTTFTKQNGSSTTIACGPVSSCKLVVEMSMATPAGVGLVSYASVPLTYAAVAPSAPTSLSAIAGDGSASISFTAGATGGSLIQKYQFSTDNGSTWSDINDTSSPVTVSGLTNGTAYNILLRAVNAAGNGASSASAVSVTPRTTPSAPTSLSATAGNGSASISFTAGATGGSLIQKYQFSTDNGSTWSDAAAGTTSPVTVSGLTNGTTYNIKLRAVNAAGNGASSASAVSVTLPTVPGAPADVVGLRGSGKVTVSWVAPVNNGGSAITGYTVTASPQVSSVTKTCTTTSTSCDVIGLTNGTAYTFTVKATNIIGDSVASGVSQAITPSTAAALAPSNPSGFAVDTASNGTFVVHWTAPTDNKGSSITTYTVRATATGQTTRSCTVDFGTNSCSVANVVNGVKYTLTLVATNAKGNSAGTSLNNKLTTAAPDAPTGVSAGQTANSSPVKVSWTKPNDNGASISLYTVTAYLNNVLVVGKSCTSNGAANCTISGLSKNTGYTFKVTATNSVGTSVAGVSGLYTTKA